MVHTTVEHKPLPQHQLQSNNKTLRKRIIVRIEISWNIHFPIPIPISYPIDVTFCGRLVHLWE